MRHTEGRDDRTDDLLVTLGANVVVGPAALARGAEGSVVLQRGLNESVSSAPYALIELLIVQTAVAFGASEVIAMECLPKGVVSGLQVHWMPEGESAGVISKRILPCPWQ